MKSYGLTPAHMALTVFDVSCAERRKPDISLCIRQPMLGLHVRSDDHRHSSASAAAGVAESPPASGLQLHGVSRAPLDLSHSIHVQRHCSGIDFRSDCRSMNCITAFPFIKRSRRRTVTAVDHPDVKTRKKCQTVGYTCNMVGLIACISPCY